MNELNSTNLLLIALTGSLIAVAFGLIYFGSSKREGRKHRS